MIKELVKLPFPGEEIYQFKGGNCITSDTAFLSDTIKAYINNQHKHILELGSANGIILFMLHYWFPEKNYLGLEIQEELSALAEENKQLLAQRKSIEHIDFKCFDLRHAAEYFSACSFDLIFSNPPFYPVDKGLISPNKQKAISRHELTCTMYDILSVISFLLSETGIALVMYPGFRAEEMVQRAEEFKLKIVEKISIDKNTCNSDFPKNRIIYILKKSEEKLE